ncbi:T9SS type A sorting domain-containing protein [Reichenbachiella sp.]
MKGYLLLSLIIVLSFQAMSQSNGRVITSDDPNNDPNWDWRVDNEYKVYFGSSTSVNQATVRLPYFTSGGPFEDINQDEIDYHPEDGWRLIYRDFGWEESSIQPEIPFFMLYNRYTGVLRFFYFIPPPPVGKSASYSLVNIAFLDNTESGALLTFNDDNKPFKIDFDNSADRSDTFIGKYQNNAWGYADFNIFGYDPDLHPQAAFSINIYAVEESAVNLEGDGSGNLNQVLANQNPTQSLTSIVTDVFGGINQGVSFAKSAGQAWEIFSESSDKAAAAGGVNINGSNIENIFSGSSNGRSNVEPISIVQGVSAAAGFITKFLGGNSQPTPIQFSLDFNLDLSGTITLTTPEFTGTFAIPHSQRFDNGSGSYYRPLYVDEEGNDIPIGIFNLEKKPTIERWVELNGWNNSPEYVANLYEMEPIKYYFNDWSGLSIKSYELSIIEYNEDSTVISTTPFLNAGLLAEYPIRQYRNNANFTNAIAYKIELQIDEPTKLLPETLTVLKVFPGEFVLSGSYHYKGDAFTPYEDRILTVRENDLTLNGNYSSNDIIVARSIHNSSEYNINVSEVDEFIAGDFIKLNSGFHAPYGSKFSAIVPRAENFETGRLFRGRFMAMSFDDLLSASNSISNTNDLKNLMISGTNSEDAFNEFEITYSYPNPFNESLSINFTLPKEQALNITIVDLKGNKIIDQSVLGTKGLNKWNWNGCNYNNSSIEAGMYIYTISGKDFKVANRILKK